MKWLGVALIQPNVIHDLVDQIRHGVKDAAKDAVAGDHAQPISTWFSHEAYFPNCGTWAKALCGMGFLC